MTLEGKGFFIWKIRDCENGNITAIANLAQQAGFSHVLIKVADGNYSYNIAPDQKDLVPPLTYELHRRNILSWGWHYIYGDDPLGEANKAIQRIQQANLKGYAIDVEGEYKQPGKKQAAVIFMNRLRSVYPSLPVALCSYRFPSYHPIPWKEFLERCDYNMPQVYWEHAHNPTDQLTRSVTEFRSLVPYRPIIPVGSAYKTGNWAATPEDVVAFMGTAKSLNLSAVNFWEWSNCRKYITETWEAIRDYTWSETPPALDIAQQYILALNSIDIEKILKLYTTTAVHVSAARTVHGTAALRAWYQSLLNQTLPKAVFNLTSFTGSGNSRHLAWTATSQSGIVLNGNDTFGLINGKIAYHYTSFNIT